MADTSMILAAILSGIGQQRKKSAMEDTLEKARQKGYDIDITLDPATGKPQYKMHYKSKTQSELMEDQFNVAKMLYEANKWKKEAGQTAREEEFNTMADLGFGGGAQDLYRAGISNEYRDRIKKALKLRNKYRMAGQTLIPTEEGYQRIPIKKTKTETATDIANNIKLKIFRQEPLTSSEVNYAENVMFVSVPDELKPNTNLQLPNKQNNQRIKVIAPDGTVGTIPSNQLSEAIKSGYKRAR